MRNATALLPDGSCAKRFVLIEGRKIIRVSAEAPENIAAQQIDLTGYFLLPGFIHAHLHLFECFDGFNESRLKQWLAAGFTTLRDEGILSWEETIDAVHWRERFRNDAMHPGIMVCGRFLAAPGGYGGANPVGVQTPAEARNAVKRMIDEGVDHIKTSMDSGSSAQNLPLLSEETLAALCDEAHRHGKRVSAHVNCADYVPVLLRAGIDEMAHACGERLGNEVLQTMVQQHVAMTPTLSVYGEITTNWGAPLLANAIDNVRRFVDLGGVIGFGNDYITEKPVWSPVGMPMMEIQLLQKANLSMRTILRSMTLGGALILGREDLGRIQEGCQANLVAVRGDPTELPCLLMNMNFIMKDGIAIKHE